MTRIKISVASWLVAATLVTGVPLVSVLATVEDAHAVVGRPATPVSYAGVARRTSRRTTRRTVARTTAAITTLPSGCVVADGIYTCGTVRYEQVFDEGQVVYVEVD